jgi:hypothetical protein
MQTAPEELLARQLDITLAPPGFMRLVPAPSVEGVQIVAAWRRRWPRVGVAVVPIGRYIDHPGDFARQLKRRVGRQIGYFPVFMPLELHFIVTGPGILTRATELQLYLDTLGNLTFGNLTVTLQSIHVIDVAAGEYLADLPALEERFEEQLKHPEQQAVEDISKFLRVAKLNPFPGPSISPMQMEMDYSHRTGRAVRSARNWGRRDGTLLATCAAIDDGIERFIHGSE